MKASIRNRLAHAKRRIERRLERPGGNGGQATCPAGCPHRFHDRKIKRGRREKPVEFGHVVLLCQSGEKFITDYEVLEERIADCQLTETVIERHQALFGKRPEVLAADKGICPDAEKYAELAEQITTLAIPRRLQDFADAVMRTWQCFRAGIKGMISGLEQAFRLSRCFYRGFKGFASAVGPGVFCHNLTVLAKQGAT